jgi:2-polyprenyl-6-methoxyphenol hydroxylase-like FAD-dependent oxidoreductase
VVGADGANSAVRRLSGISTWGWGYGQEAVVATIRVGDRSASSTPSPAATSSTAAPAGNTADTATASASAATHEQPLGNAPDSEALYNAASSESPPAADGARRRRPFVNNTAWQKYLPTGPLAVLPLWDEYASIVWSTGIADAKRLKALPEAEFLAELNTALQTPPDTDKWSVFEKTDGSNLPPFLGALFGSKPFGPVSSALSQSPLQLLQRVKQEAAAVADTLMSAAQLGDPLSYPPRVTTVCGPRVSFPLNFSQASQYSAPRCALIGKTAPTTEVDCLVNSCCFHLNFRTPFLA